MSFHKVTHEKCLHVLHGSNSSVGNAMGKEVIKCVCWLCCVCVTQLIIEPVPVLGPSMKRPSWCKQWYCLERLRKSLTVLVCQGSWHVDWCLWLCALGKIWAFSDIFAQSIYTKTKATVVLIKIHKLTFWYWLLRDLDYLCHSCSPQSFHFNIPNRYMPSV